MAPFGRSAPNGNISSSSSRQVSESETKCTSILLPADSGAGLGSWRATAAAAAVVETGQRVALTKAICSPFEAIHAVIAL